MAPIPKIPETVEEYQAIVEYIRSGTFPDSILKSPITPTLRSNFVRRCKNFEVNENGVLYAKPVVKNGVVKSEKRRVVPKYDVEMRALILERFHDQANHREYHKTFSAILEKHIGITQEEVKLYVNECSTCAINTSIKEKTDIVSVVALGPWEHVQINLVDFRDFAKENEGFSWLLTCVCVFSKFLVAVPMKNKEAGTVAVHLIKDVFKILGPLTTLQSDNEELEEVTTTETTTIKPTTTEPTTTEPTTAQAVAVENRISRMLELRESVNKSLEKYRARIYQQGSVHRKKTANNMIEAGATIAIAPDHDMNPQTRKRKLQLTFSQRGVFKSLTSNNRTAVVEMNGEDIRVPIKRVKVIQNKS